MTKQIHNNNNDRLTAFDPGQPGTRRNIHPLTPIRIIVLSLSPFSICNGPWHPLYSTNVLDSPHVQPLSRSSLVFPLVLNPQLHAPYISSPSHRHLFPTHDRTSAACSAAIQMLCHLPLVSLSAPYLGVYLLKRHSINKQKTVLDRGSALDRPRYHAHTRTTSHVWTR